MSLQELITRLAQVFEVEEDQLGTVFKKTDFTDRDEVIYAAFVAWNYDLNSEVYDRDHLQKIVGSFDEETTKRMTYDAKHGFGAFDLL